MNWKVEKLKKGETFITSEKGNSMFPIIKSGQDHKLAPAGLKDVEVDDVVFCKVNGHFYTHLVKGKNEIRGCLIGNNRGGINGWTKQIYGKVIEIL
jgi:hypothetical protein